MVISNWLQQFNSFQEEGEFKYLLSDNVDSK